MNEANEMVVGLIILTVLAIIPYVVRFFQWKLGKFGKQDSNGMRKNQIDETLEKKGME